MKEIEQGNLIRIKYIEYNRKWDGYIFEGTPRLSEDEIPEEEEDEYNLVVWNSAEEDEFYVDRKHIMIRCVKNEALDSGWGYVEPFAGNGLEDCGGEPDYHFEDNLAPVWDNDVYLHGEGYLRMDVTYRDAFGEHTLKMNPRSTFIDFLFSDEISQETKDEMTRGIFPEYTRCHLFVNGEVFNPENFPAKIEDFADKNNKIYIHAVQSMLNL